MPEKQRTRISLSSWKIISGLVQKESIKTLIQVKLTKAKTNIKNQ